MFLCFWCPSLMLNHMLVCVLSRSVMSSSLRPHVLQPARLLCPWGLSRQEYWSGLPFPSPGEPPTQGSNPGLPHRRQILYHLKHQGGQSETSMTLFPSFLYVA